MPKSSRICLVFSDGIGKELASNAVAEPQYWELNNNPRRLRKMFICWFGAWGELLLTPVEEGSLGWNKTSAADRNIDAIPWL